MLKSDFSISIHHIGGRAGSITFPQLPSEFEKDLEKVLYDADESCVEKIQINLQDAVARIVVLPYCISNKTGVEEFYLCADRYNSSLIKPLPKENKYYYYDEQFCWDNDMRRTLDETCELDVISMDDLHVKQSVSIDANSPDVLSLDVEGAATKVLTGAEELLTLKTLLIEFDFHSADEWFSASDFCQKRGFHLADVDFYDSQFSFDRQIPIGLRASKGKNDMVGGVAFLKEAKAIVENHSNPALDLLKAAFLSFSLSKFDKMYSYLDEWKGMQRNKKDLEEICNKKNYLAFLWHFIDSYDTYSNIIPLRYSSYFPTSEARSRRFANKPIFPSKEQLRERYFEYVNKAEFKQFVPIMLNSEYIGIEKLCVSRGFKEHAELIKNNRISILVQLLIDVGLFKKEDETVFALNDIFFDL
ncbi:MAG: hypothetical protein GY847_37270 [Proteobacteria bacterium]|nr:hypothetical protein [Pseudomonadota bacterium]